MREGLDQYLKDNIGLVHQAASKSMPRVVGCGMSMDFDDMVQELTLVFMRAYEGWDAAKSRFSTYFMTCAYRHVNKLVDQHVRQPDTMSSSVRLHAGDDLLSLEDVTASESGAPDLFLEAKAVSAKAERELTPLARRVLALAVNPPDEIERELEAQQARAAELRAQGQWGRAPAEITTRYILSLMKRTNIVGEREAKALQVELENFGRRIYA